MKQRWWYWHLGFLLAAPYVSTQGSRHTLPKLGQSNHLPQVWHRSLLPISIPAPCIAAVLEDVLSAGDPEGGAHDCTRSEGFTATLLSQLILAFLSPTFCVLFIQLKNKQAFKTNILNWYWKTERDRRHKESSTLRHWDHTANTQGWNTSTESTQDHFIHLVKLMPQEYLIPSEIPAFGAEGLQKVIQEAAGAGAQDTHAPFFWTWELLAENFPVRGRWYTYRPSLKGHIPSKEANNNKKSTSHPFPPLQITLFLS